MSLFVQAENNQTMKRLRKKRLKKLLLLGYPNTRASKAMGVCVLEWTDNGTDAEVLSARLLFQDLCLKTTTLESTSM